MSSIFVLINPTHCRSALKKSTIGCELFCENLWWIEVSRYKRSPEGVWYQYQYDREQKQLEERPRSIMHPDGIRTGEYWMSKPITFGAVGVTNDPDTIRRENTKDRSQRRNMFVVQHRHKYRIILGVNNGMGADAFETQECYNPSCEFIAVSERVSYWLLSIELNCISEQGVCEESERVPENERGWEWKWNGEREVAKKENRWERKKDKENEEELTSFYVFMVFKSIFMTVFHVLFILLILSDKLGTYSKLSHSVFQVIPISTSTLCLGVARVS